MTRPYRPYNVATGEHGTPQEEWAPHAAQTEKTFEWWYITNILKDEKENMLFQHVILFQFAGSNILKAVGLKGNEGNGHYLCSLAMSDYSKNMRILEESFAKVEEDFDHARNAMMFNSNGFNVDWVYQDNRLLIKGKSPRQHFDLNFIDTQGALWHKDTLDIDGMIAESSPDEPSFYYSIPTLEVEGSVGYIDDAGKGKSYRVTGQGWCDRQWGDYLTKSWEWCSMRFFDGDRANLYAFPQTGHKVGTYRSRDGAVVYFNNFTIWQKNYFETPNSVWLASAWEYEVPFKEKKYKVISASQNDLIINPENTLLESMGFIYDEKGELVGYTANESMDLRVTKTGPYKNKI